MKTPKIEYFVSVSLRDTRVTDKLEYTHRREDMFNPENYPHHTICGYALFARMQDSNGVTLDHHLGFDTNRETVDMMVHSADAMVTALNYQTEV